MGLALCPFLVLHHFQTNEKDQSLASTGHSGKYVRTRHEQSNPVPDIFPFLPIRKLIISQARSCI